MGSGSRRVTKTWSKTYQKSKARVQILSQIQHEEQTLKSVHQQQAEGGWGGKQI